ncbi:MAG: VWA domain-containing protein [Acidobacteria bacterium]|nr:VWA domain-containing protein [Acidobacteriota bacterium]
MRRAILLLVLLGAPVCAQKPELQTDPDFRLRRTVDVVNVDVAVTDARGNFLRDLRRENFRILDEGAERPITHFASVEAPALVLVLVETSPAVYMIQQQHLDAAYALLDGLAADDWVALATYSEKARTVLNFTQDKGALGGALRGLRFNLGMAELKFLDSMSTALDWLAPLPGRKALVLLSTGLDAERDRRWAPLSEKLRASEVSVYAVALGGSLREYRQGKAPASEESALSFEQANRDLKAMAEITGGRSYFPKSPREFEGIYRQVSSALRHQYSLGFSPGSHDGRFHRIEVQVVDEKGRVVAPVESKKGKPAYRVSARQGYLAPQ